MNFRILNIFILIGLLCFSSCDRDFEEINTNPNDPTIVPSDLLVADAVRIAGNRLYSTFTGGDMGACWAQQWAKVQYNDEARYKPRESVIESTWDNLYEDVIASGKTIELLAIEEENEVTQAIGLILQAYGFLLLTDCYGDVPFVEALRAGEGIISPKYDTQESIYEGVFAILDNANTLLDSGNGSVVASSDLLYDGDASGWQKFANSLKFRALMRISAKKDVSAQLTDIVTNRNIFTSNADEAKLQYLDADPNANPIYETIVFGPRNEWKINSFMVEKLETLSDPRLPVFAQPNDEGVIRGKPSGIIDVPNNEYAYANVSPLGTHYLDPTWPGYFLSYSELLFLMAEAAQKGYISGDAGSFYTDAIKANFESNGVTEGFDAYVEQASVAWDAGDWERRIGDQKWIALFSQGVEAWTEQRRTGYPQLQPAIEAEFNQIPSRYTYPSIEQSVNKDNYEAAVSALGGNSLTGKIWWMN